jgi:sugar lactone lactonase YvrE
MSDTQIIFITPARDSGIASLKLNGNGPNAYAEFLYLPPALEDLPAGYITTVMGIGQFRGDGRIATKAMIESSPIGLGILRDGSIVFTEPNQFVVRHVRTDGVIERYAGTGVSGYSGDGGSATKALLGHPRGLAVDSAGNVLITDTVASNCIRRINAATGIITTIYGKQSAGFSGDGGPAVNAQFNSPLQITFDGMGNLYVLDFGNVRIRKIDANGIITTVAGTGGKGFSGDGGPATNATFDFGNEDFGGLAADSQGNVYIADSFNNRVRRIDGHTGIITTFIADVNWVVSVLTDPQDNLYVGATSFASVAPSDSGSNELDRILKLSSTGHLLQSWGRGYGFSDDGSTAVTTSICQSTRFALDNSGNILFGEFCSNRIRRINISTGLLETVAGMGPHIVGETGSALETVVSDPGTDLVFLPSGDLLTGEGGNYRIRKMDRHGNVEDVAGTGFGGPVGKDGGPALRYSMPIWGIALAPNDDILVDLSLIGRIDGSGNIHILTNGQLDFRGDGGPAKFAATDQPWDVTADSGGNIFIADTNNNRIRRIDAATQIIDTVAGSGRVNGQEGYGRGGYCGDSGPATQACLNTPYGIAVAPDGTMYIGENFQRIRKVIPGGTISTFFSGGGNKIRLTPSGNLFMTPYRIEPNGHSFQFAFSSPSQSGIGDGGPAGKASWIPYQQCGIAVDREGNVFLSDPGNKRVRAVRFGAIIAEPGSTLKTVAGGSQTTPTQTKFSVPLEVTLMSPAGTPENGIRVDFSAPASSASCRFPNGSSAFSVLTDVNGHASVVCTANATAGSYNVTAAPLNLAQSVSFSLTNNAATSAPLPIAVNISTRDTVGSANGVMIGGFIIQGSESKSLMIRAIGPSLTQFGVNNALGDPTLELHDSSGATIATNDNWGATQHGGVIKADQVTNIRNSGLAPTQPYEAAMIVQLQAGAYTAIVGGVKGTAGIGLVEVYDLDSNVNSRLANISTRGSVDTGDNVMIGGFIVQGNQPKKMVIRGIGPSLKPFGINNALGDPTVELHDSSGQVIATNNNWQTTQVGGVITGDQMNDIKNSGLAPSDPLEAAIIVTLPPAAYTAILRGGNGIGIGLVEVYALQ